MNELSNKEAYRIMFREYPDIVDIEQLRAMLGRIGIKTAYKLLQKNEIVGFKIGRAYKIPKINVISYLNTVKKTCSSNDDSGL